MSDTPVDPAAPPADPADEPAVGIPTTDPALEPTDPVEPAVVETDTPDVSGATPADPVTVEGLADPIGPDAEMRAAVAEAGQDLQPGQTITTTQAGKAVVTGIPTPDGKPEPSVTLHGSGSSTAIATPIGTVGIVYEIDAQGVRRVSVTSYPLEPGFNVLSDAVLLRQTSS